MAFRTPMFIDEQHRGTRFTITSARSNGNSGAIIACAPPVVQQRGSPSSRGSRIECVLELSVSRFYAGIHRPVPSPCQSDQE